MSEGGNEVFVSYTAADRRWAEWVSQVLESAGMSVRMQAWDVAAGANLVQWIGQQLYAADHIVALYSAKYFTSYWCTEEWTSALARGSLIPIRVEEVDPPAPLDVHNYVDLFNVDERNAQVRLLEAVNVLPVARRAVGGFPGSSTSTTRSPTFSDHPETRTSYDSRIDDWLEDLTELDRARDLIDEKVRIEFQRKILDRRFSGQGISQEALGDLNE